MNRRNVFWGVSLLTLAVLMLELTLTRLFSATMYYHFAFMAISLALLGSGISGVFVYLFLSRVDERRTGQLLSVASLLFALSTVMSLSVILANPLVFEGGGENLYRLSKVYLATTLPIFFAGCAVTLAITRFAKDISRLYLFDLAGAALGCLLFIPVLNQIGAINTMLLVSVIGMAASLLFSMTDAAGRALTFPSIALFVILVSLLAFNVRTDRIEVIVAKGGDQRNVVFSKWNSFSRVTVERDSADNFQIKIDSDAATGIARGATSDADLQGHRDRIHSLAYHLHPRASVLIIGPGGGNDVMSAQAFEASQITAVEINPIIAIDVMSSEPFRSYSGDVYFQPNVRLVVDEARSFIRRSSDRYDVIQGTMVDTWAATAAGAFALTENNLYTVEAFKDYVAHLTDDGVLTMTRWYFEPPDQALRLISLTRAMMTELGIDNPSRHIVFVRELWPDGQRSPATFMFKKSELTDDEVRTLEAVAASNDFELLYTPLTRPDNDFTRLIEAEDPSDVWDAYVTNIEPPRDNNPFFFNSIRLSNLRNLPGGVEEWQKTNLGTFVLVITLGFTTLLVLLFIIGPLALMRSRDLMKGSPATLPSLLYFACLGAGFMIVEVAMIQKFILFLGHPVYALAVVLFSVLTFCAIGSHLSGRIRDDRRVAILPRVLVALVALTIVYIVILPPIFYGFVHLALPLRIILAVLLLAPLAVMMGVPMPTGIRILADSSPEIIPWAWGVNGATSVLGSIAALIIALLTGFNQALMVGAALYLLAGYFGPRMHVATAVRSQEASTVEG